MGIAASRFEMALNIERIDIYIYINNTYIYLISILIYTPAYTDIVLCRWDRFIRD